MSFQVKINLRAIVLSIHLFGFDLIKNNLYIFCYSSLLLIVEKGPLQMLTIILDVN